MAVDFNFRCSLTIQTTKLFWITIFLLLTDGSLPVSSIKFEDSKEKIDSSESFPKKGNNLDYKDRSMEVMITEFKNLQMTCNSSINSALFDKDRKQEKEIKELKHRVASLESASTCPQKSNVKGRQKKAGRLIPLSLLQNKVNSYESMKNGMPTSCKDLNELGYTLKGFYLVRNPKLSALETIFCDFKENPFSVYNEKKIGQIHLKSSPGVYFFVLRNESFTRTTGVINYQYEKLNIGEAINLKTGVFRAPRPGIYHFSFIGTKHWLDTDAGVYFRLNGKHVSASYVRGFMTAVLHLNLEATLKLAVGDVIDVYKYRGGTISEGEHENKPYRFTQFTGRLLEEEFTTLL